MTDDEQRPSYFYTMVGGGTPRGGLPDPGAATVQLEPVRFGEGQALAMFAEAIERQRVALSRYADAIEAAGGDVTAPAVQDAATELHAALRALPIAHVAYTGVGFPTARRDGRAAEHRGVSPVRGAAGFGVHPDMLTAIQGDVSQRWGLGGEENLPLSVEVVLATDPDPQVRSSFLGLPRSRTVVLLMEQRETDEDVLGELARQRYASPERKLPLVLTELIPRELDGLYELLGFRADEVAAAYARWNLAHERRERITVGDALREIGLLPPGSSDE